MGCGISKFDPKEVVEVKATSSNKFASFNCFTGESKSNNLVEQRPTNNHNNGCHTLEGQPRKGHEEKTKMKVNVKREGGEAKFEDDRCSGSDDENEKNGRGICQGGSPSFREYCIDSDLESRSFKSEDCCEEYCKWPSERTQHPEKEKGLESEMVKKERAGKGIRNVSKRGKSGGVRNFLTASRRQQHNDGSEKLLLKSS